MKRFILLLLSLVSIFAVALFSVSCGGDKTKPSTPVEKPSEPDTPDPDKPDPDEPSEPSDPELKNFTGIVFENGNFVYDGNEKIITVKNVPEGAAVSYTGNTAVDAGVYNATAAVSKEGYNPLTLKATLTITEADMNGVTFTGVEYTYDGTEKTITAAGIPSGAQVRYTSNTATDAGIYNATAIITKKNYKTLTLKATLTINEAEMSGVTFTGAEYTYDGTEKTITAAGVPSGAQVEYTSNTATDAGVYNATATVTKKNYKTLTLKATLTINKADIVGITFENTTVEYDTLSHSIEIVGDLPAEVNVKTTYNGEETDAVTEVGEYTVVLTISGRNYNTFTKTATLKITSTEERLFSAVYSGGVYFQNNLDDNKLYSYANGSLSKINNDVPEYLTVIGNKLYYSSKALFGSAIKTYSSAESAASVFTNVAGEYLATDGSYLYYAKNSLVDTKDTNGIYKVAISGSDAAPVRIVKDKAAYIVVVGNYLYYSNLSDGKKLYRVSKTADDLESGVKARSGDLADEKVEYLIADGTELYFNSTKTLVGVGVAAAVRKLDTASNKEIKLTTDAGKYLNKVDNYIYYVNSDKLTSELCGDGIYRVSVSMASDNNKSGEKIFAVTDGNGYSSLASDGKYLYYYKLNDKHFYRNSLSGNDEVDLMKGFVPPAPVMKVACYAETKVYNGEVYFINSYGDGMLYKYNLASKRVNKVLEDRVSNMYFYNGYMYYSTCIATNYALFRMNLQTKESEKISSDRCDKLIFDGDTIYYVKVGSAYNNDIHKMGLDGSNPTKLLDKSLWVSNLEKSGDTLYFATNNALGKSTFAYNLTTGKATDLKKPSTFVTVEGNTIYYYNSKTQKLMSCGIDGNNEKTIKDNVDVNEIVVNNGKLYYSDVTSQTFNVYDLGSGKTTKIADTCADGISISDGKLYYIGAAVNYQNDYPLLSAGDGRLYCYDGTKVTKLF